MPTIAQLNQRNPACDPEHALDLYAIYEGDREFEKRISRFLHRRDREPIERYELRKKEFQYRNYIGAIIDNFASMLFTSKPVAQAFQDAKAGPLKPRVDDKGNSLPFGGKKAKPFGAPPPSGAPDPKKGPPQKERVVDLDPYYSKLRDDSDLAGKDIDGFFKDRITEAMILGCAWIAIESPTDDPDYPAINKLEFDARKLGDCWLKAMSPNSVLDWETDDAGNLEWVIYHSSTAKRNGLTGDRNMVTETWTHYQADRIDTYAITYDRTKPPEPKTEVPLVNSRPHNFGCAPIVCLQLPKAQHVASRLKSPQLANFRKINEQSWSLTCSAYAMPVVKVNDPEAFNEMAAGAGYGVVIGVDEDFGYEAPPSAAFAPLDIEIKATKDEIFRIAFQMALGVENNAAAVGRTAESKSQDAQSTRVALTSFGRLVKAAIEQVYDLISEARGDDYEWDVTGLDDFAGIDTGGLMALVTDMNASGYAPGSKTFKGQLQIKMAESVLPDLDERTKATIRDEILDAVENEPTPEEKELMQFEAMHQIASENAPVKAGAGGTSGAKPFGAPKIGKGGSRPPFGKKK